MEPRCRRRGSRSYAGSAPSCATGCFNGAASRSRSWRCPRRPTRSARVAVVPWRGPIDASVIAGFGRRAGVPMVGGDGEWRRRWGGEGRDTRRRRRGRGGAACASAREAPTRTRRARRADARREPLAPSLVPDERRIRTAMQRSRSALRTAGQEGHDPVAPRGGGSRRRRLVVAERR